MCVKCFQLLYVFIYCKHPVTEQTQQRDESVITKLLIL